MIDTYLYGIFCLVEFRCIVVLVENPDCYFRSIDVGERSSVISSFDDQLEIVFRFSIERTLNDAVDRVFIGRECDDIQLEIVGVIQQLKGQSTEIGGIVIDGACDGKSMSDLNGFRERDVLLKIQELTGVIVDIENGDVQCRRSSGVDRDEVQNERASLARAKIRRTPCITIDHFRGN